MTRRGARQYERISAEVERDPRVKALLQRLEADYDARVQTVTEASPQAFPQEPPRLSPSLEQFLGELGDQMDKPKS